MKDTHEKVLLLCFKKELALNLKLLFADGERTSGRRVFYLHLNYFEVPEFCSEGQIAVDELNHVAYETEAIVMERIRDHLDNLLAQFMLSVVQTKSFLECISS